MFDWTQFLSINNIPFVTKGHNVGKGNIGITCPFCGDDPSYHLGISLNGKGWHCWRNHQHSGKAPQKLIVALIGCSYAEADRLAKSGQIRLVTTDDNFVEESYRALGINLPVDKIEFVPYLFFPKEFKTILGINLGSKLAVDYLVNDRGYKYHDIAKLSGRFTLSYTMIGPFAYRIIIPIYMDGVLVNWTGRSIVKKEELRYKTLTTDPEKSNKEGTPIALRNIKECLFDYDNIRYGGRILVVCEGPFDAMRITWFGQKYGILGTCLFNKELTPRQLELLLNIRNDFDSFVTLYDKDSIKGEDFMTFPNVDILKVTSMYLPDPVKDPAELDKVSFNNLFGL